MRNIVFMFLSLLPLVSFSQKKKHETKLDCSCNGLDKGKNGRYYCDGKKFTGMCEFNTSTGTWVLRRGRRLRAYTYYPDGKKEAVTIFKRNDTFRKMTSWDENGKIEWIKKPCRDGRIKLTSWDKD